MELKEKEFLLRVGGSTGTKVTLQSPHRPKQMTNTNIHETINTFAEPPIGSTPWGDHQGHVKSPPCWHKGHPTWQNRSQRSSAIVHIIIPLWLLSRSFCSSAKVPPFLCDLFDVRENMSEMFQGTPELVEKQPLLMEKLDLMSTLSLAKWHPTWLGGEGLLMTAISLFEKEVECGGAAWSNPLTN